jgi:hypothetical protein
MRFFLCLLPPFRPAPPQSSFRLTLSSRSRPYAGFLASRTAYRGARVRLKKLAPCTYTLCTPLNSTPSPLTDLCLQRQPAASQLEFMPSLRVL